MATDSANVESINERLEAFLSNGEPEEFGDDKKPEEVLDSEDTEEEQPEETEEEESGESSEADDAQEEGETLELSELAEYLGLEQDRLDVNEDGELVVKTKIDGEEGKAKLNDLIKSYQLEGHLNKQNMEVAEMKKSLAQKQEQFEAQMQQRLDQVEDLAKVAWQQLESDSGTEDLDRQLRDGDITEGEYALQKMRLKEKQDRIAQMYQQVQQERNQFSGISQERLHQTLADEGQKLLQAIPEWSDEKVAQKERGDVVQYAKSLGFSDEEVNSFTDHRAIVAIRKAMKFDQLEKTKPDVSKKVKRAPKLSKPGALKTEEDSKTKKLTDLRRTIKKSGGKDKRSVNDLLAAKGII